MLPCLKKSACSVLKGWKQKMGYILKVPVLDKMFTIFYHNMTPSLMHNTDADMQTKIELLSSLYN